MTQLLQIDPETQVAAGVQRSVYRHPTDQTKLIKVLRPETSRAARSNFNGVMDRLFPSTRLRQIRKEYQEYLRFMLSLPTPDYHVPISHMFGFVQTNLGLGGLTERIVAPDGGLGETLAAMVDTNALAQSDLALLNDTIHRLFDSGLRASDLNAKNFVFGQRYVADTLGARDCVLVDGFGDIHAIPVRSMALWSNHVALSRSCLKLARNTGMTWDNKRRVLIKA